MKNCVLGSILFVACTSAAPQHETIPTEPVAYAQLETAVGDYVATTAGGPDLPELMLALASIDLSHDRRAQGRKILETIVRTYPLAPAASRARELLEGRAHVDCTRASTP